MKRFSPGQVVTMVVAVCAAVVLMPVAVGAATGSFTNIVDPVNAASKVRVNPTGTLWTTEVDPLTRAQAKVGADGARLVGGTVGTRQVPPLVSLDTVNDITLNAGGTRKMLFSGVGPRKVSMTSLIASAEGANPGYVKLFFIVYVKTNSTTGDCVGLTGGGFGAAERFVITVPIGNTVNINWPTALVWTQYANATAFFCIDVESSSASSGYIAHVAVHGYRN